MLALALLGAAWAADLAIVHATALPVSGPPIPDATLLVEDGRILALGPGLPVPEGTPQVDAAGRFLMPGIIDVHSHMGVYAWPGSDAHSDGNEATEPLTPGVGALDGVRVADPAFARARAGGVTTIQVLPGSANLVGGEGVILKLRPARRIDDMRLAGAPRVLKMACGENPKRVHQGEEHGPSTRMGNVATLRQALQGALDYRLARQRSREPVAVDLDQEVLLDLLDGELRLNVHCYRSDDMEAVYRVLDEFHVQVHSFHHALEAYKVRDLLAAHGTGIATWPDWWGFKMEAFDAIPENAALVAAAGVPVALHSDSADVVQRLYVEAAKMLRYGMDEPQALAAITLEPARLLGLEARIGSLEPGKDADMVLFSRHPLDVMTRVDLTWIEGQLVHDRQQAEAADAAP